MKPVWQALAWTGGVLGAAATTAVVGVAAHGARSRRQADPYAEEQLGELRPDRRSTVAADDGVPLAVQEVEPADGGNAELTVVLVHGYALDARSWHFQRRDLPRHTDPRVRLVLFDQRGHGRSGRSSRERSTIEQTARDLDAVLRATVERGPILLAGHSMGGMTIMALAEQRPELFRERVRGVALINTSAGEVGAEGLGGTWLSPRNPVTSGIGVLAGWQPALVEQVRRAGGRIAWNLVRTLAFGENTPPPTLVDLVDDMIAGTTVEVVFDFIRTLGAHERTAALSTMRHHAALVVGGTADRVVPCAHSEVIAAELPRAESLRIDGAGHLTMLEEHEVVTARLAALIRRAAREGCVDTRTSMIELPTEEATIEFGHRLGGVLRAGDLVLLDGALGAGKTVLTRGIAAGMGVTGRVASPTFVLARVHQAAEDGPALVHVDAYRLTGLDEIDDLDLDTDLTEAAVVVEWGAGMAERLTEEYLVVELRRRADDVRELTLVPHGERWDRPAQELVPN